MEAYEINAIVALANGLGDEEIVMEPIFRMAEYLNRGGEAAETAIRQAVEAERQRLNEAGEDE